MKHLCQAVRGEGCLPKAIRCRVGLNVNYTLSPVPDSLFPIPCFRFPIPDSRFPIPDSRFPLKTDTCESAVENLYLLAPRFRLVKHSLEHPP
ncbi:MULTISPECIES: hypothetical protein [unclassified Moorena]|uniref:hypothetical protein n=1 Tax=unclassified Moorena TaxID=2683338 RepID=UPI0013B5B2BB|nr:MULTISPECIES: hypothetical protein [unclassified Moorena]NEP31878.1 hypothetical protein [Moorena sp. SIO3B2]NEQ08446.1 hypothetical protein [Moorena sp. SIO4E2]NER88811.1 hypothetical protein [Moorena sp. SIO3A2]